MLDDSGNAFVVDGNFVVNAALAAKVENGATVSYKTHVAVAQRGQPEAFVVARILGIADTDPGGIENAHHHREHLLARQSRTRQVT